MENGKCKKIISLVLYFLNIAFFAVFLVLAILGKKFALFITLGFICHYILSAFFHELGHFIVGKICKMVFVEGKVLCFKLYRKNGKIKFGFCSPIESGEISMVSTVTENAGSDLIKLTIGGNLFVFLYLIICVLLGCIIGGNAFYFFFVASEITAYTLIINLIPLADNGDGALLFGLLKGKEKYKSAMSLAVIQSYLYNGLSPAQIPEQSIYVSCGEYSQAVELIKLLKLIDSSKIERAYVYSKDLTTRTSGAILERVKKEKFFLAVIMGLKEEVDKDKEEVLNSLTENSFTDMRINYYYRVYTKETEWAKLIKNQCNKLKNAEFFKGLAKMEEKLINFEKQKTEYTEN